MRNILPIAAAIALSASGAAYAGPAKIDLKGNKNVTKIGVKVPGTGSVKIMDNPANLKVKAQVPGTGKVQVKLPSPL